MTASRAPLPPPDLAARVGPGPDADPLVAYDREGADVRARLEGVLPADWAWEGKRVLDFGCGAARVLRHFLPEAEYADFWGCDIDGPSVEWIQAHLSPPLHAFQNALAPPLDLDSGTFDLIYATSVFTHIDALWSRWLLELRRILKPGGLLVSTWVGPGFWEAFTGSEPYREDEVGMTVLGHWTGPDAVVMHSEWWLREHWGRALDVVAVERPPRGEVAHCYIALRKREDDDGLTPSDLERRDPAELRELAALDTTIRLLRNESAGLADALTRPPVRPALRAAILASPVGEPARRAVRALRRRTGR
jgi:SAM-dependent methyltransferase